MTQAMDIQVVGAGSFGLALSHLLAHNGHTVRLWCRAAERAQRLRESRMDEEYLPGLRLPDSVDVGSDIDPDAGMAVLAVPSHALRDVVSTLAFSKTTVRVNVAKGIEEGSLMRMSQVIRDVAPGGPVVTLSGPSHAEEVARGLPASVVVAGADPDACGAVVQAFFSEAFRVYTSPDIVGVELGGALKNVIAIAAGACDGLGLGDNAKASLITRGLAEIQRLGEACGAEPLTFGGLSGMGDLIVTCTSRHSRNRRLGESVAAGQPLEAILGGTRMVAEGVRTAQSARALAHRKSVSMPIATAVHSVLFEGKQPRHAIGELMLRDAKPERG